MADDFVLVGCKMPGGVKLTLKRCEVIHKETGSIRVIDGELPDVTLRGNAIERAASPRGGTMTQDPSFEGLGYVYTRVPRAFWERWLELNPPNGGGLGSLLKDGYLQAPPKSAPADLKAFGREMEERQGKDPPIGDPTKDPRTRALGLNRADEMKGRDAKAGLQLGVHDPVEA